MKLKLLLSCIFIILVSISQANDNNIFNVISFGATGQKSQTATTHIQEAIDECHENGGGTVYFPPGDYLLGTIVLKSNVTLEIEAGATLWASLMEEDYNVPFPIHKGDESDTPVLIYANGAENIGITGKGSINGQAERVYEDLDGGSSFIKEEISNAQEAGVPMKRYYKVPPFVSLGYLVDCSNVHISQVSFIESSSWTLHVQWSERVYVNEIYIQSSLEAGVNADGLDIDGCRDVAISGCVIETGDDAIVLKSTLTNNNSEDVRNVTASNCVLTSTSSALKIGTETHGDFDNIVFNNWA